MKIYTKLLSSLIAIIFIVSLSYLPTVKALNKQQVIKISGNMALFSDNTVWVWGDNAYGSDGSTFDPRGLNQPIKIKEFSDIVDIADGSGYSVALKRDGTVWVWGDGQFGQLGNGESMFTRELTFPLDKPEPYSQKPIQVKGVSDIISISAGSHVLALKKDGTVWAWGPNGMGQIGVRKSNLETTTPTQVVDLPPIKAVVAGPSHSLALDKNGEVWVWGDNFFGKAGDGTQTELEYNGDTNREVGISQNKYSPVKVNGLSNVVKVQAVSDWFNLAFKQDGSVWFWGKNNLLSFSHGETANQLAPREIPELRGTQDMVSNYYSSMILKNDGRVWTLGFNKFGQLGNGTKHDNMKPGQVSFLSNIIGIESYGESSFALRNDGTVWAWGRNDNADLGNRNRYLFLTPRQIIFNKETKIVDQPIELFVNDELVQSALPPKMINGKLYIPSTSLAKKLGYSATRQGESALIMKNGKRVITVYAGSKNAKVNAKTVKLNQPVTLLGNEYWLPINSILPLFHAKANYESKNQIVNVSTK